MPTKRKPLPRPSKKEEDEFFKFYLRQHSHPLTRAVHYAGTVGAILVATGLAKNPLDGVGGGGGATSDFIVSAERIFPSCGFFRPLKAAAVSILRRVAGSLLIGYGPSWLSHFFVEKNRPATWEAPLLSLRSDLRMLWCFLAGSLRDELRAAGVS